MAQIRARMAAKKSDGHDKSVPRQSSVPVVDEDDAEHQPRTPTKGRRVVSHLPKSPAPTVIDEDDAEHQPRRPPRISEPPRTPPSLQHSPSMKTIRSTSHADYLGLNESSLSPCSVLPNKEVSSSETQGRCQPWRRLRKRSVLSGR